MFCGSVGVCLFSRVVVSCILCNAQARGRGGTLRPEVWAWGQNGPRGRKVTRQDLSLRKLGYGSDTVGSLGLGIDI